MEEEEEERGKEVRASVAFDDVYLHLVFVCVCWSECLLLVD